MNRYWEILETIVAAGKPLSASEVAGLIDIPRATCYRLVAELADLAIIDAVGERQQYVLGRKFVTLALLGKADTDVSRAVSSALQKLAGRFGETAFIARIRAGDVELMHTELPQDTSASFIYPGLGKRPIHACSSAKAIAAFAEKGTLSSLLRGKLERFNSKTIVSRKSLQDELDKIRQNGFALCDQEIDEGVVSVAAPVHIHQVGVIFSIGFVGPAKRMYGHLENGVAKELTGISKTVAAALRHCTPLDASRMANNTTTDYCQPDWPTGMMV